MKSVFIYLTAVVLFCGFISSESSALIGGQRMENSHWIKNAFPLIIHIKEKSEICTSTFLTKAVILTAAHCVPSPKNIEKMQVQISTNSRTLGTTLSVRDYVVHEKYVPEDAKNNSAPQNDVALIFLEQEFADAVVSQLRAPEAGAVVNVFGFGLGSEINPEDSFGAGYLRRGILRLKDYDLQTPIFTADNSQDYSVCTGDSGGPTIFFDGRQLINAGVLSYVRGRSGNLKCNGIAEYVNALYYKSWIENVINSRQAWRSTRGELPRPQMQ